MKPHTMKTLTTRDIEIPGGWQAWIPEGTDDEQALQAYTRYFQADGFPPGKAREKAEETLRRVLEQDWKRRLTQFVRREARRHHARVGSLAGFDPEKLQSGFMPWDQDIGRHGKAALRQLRSEMIRAGLEEQHESD